MSRILRENSGCLVTLEGDLVKKVVYGLNKSRLSRKVSPKEMVDREIRALQLLQGIPGIQEFVRRESDNIFYTKYMGNQSLRLFQGNISASYFDKLIDIIKQCHMAGVYRNGLARRDYLITSSGDPGIIDFGNIIFSDDKAAKIPGVLYLSKIYNHIRIWDLKKEFTSDIKSYIIHNG